MTILRRLIIAVLALSLAACGPLPRPFQQEKSRNNALLTLEDGTGIVVLQPESELISDPGAWAEAMAEALRARDIPASTNHGNAGSRYLYSHITEDSAGNQGKSVSVLWDLYSADGKLAGSHALDTELTSDAFKRAPETAMKRSIEAAADKLAAFAGTEPRPTRSIPGYPDARIHVPPFGDAPGDAGTSLRKAILAELSDSKLPLTGKATSKDLVLLCEISLGPDEGGTQRATIFWRLLSLEDDEELGVIDQSNYVPTGSLDGFWGPTAGDIARGAREGILDLMAQLRANS